MSELHPDYEGLTVDEVASLVDSSAQKPGEDSDTWKSRTQQEAATARALAASRRDAQTAETVPEGEPVQ